MAHVEEVLWYLFAGVTLVRPVGPNLLPSVSRLKNKMTGCDRSGVLLRPVNLQVS